MTPEEIKQINDSYARPYILSFTVEEALRVKHNLSCKYCEYNGEKRRHTKDSRCGKCQKIAEHLKETKVLVPKLF